mmetsp:Transcript_23292/g.41184  ORF Transcript_23292/g.41184 Transcript_23292/m.41184 type:complete len:128 (+) Transcript_23292:54-437(+)|eukprot:CAMPEP_0184528986 /NCGR_PEP_ID=MMETSP0198_2-20121128/12109_1 /TAXON_ID=1112570 /ORGANISM="Thraustochytrium sp., Strain LLF1b" /LENGTH=127 /DNA_ID=CAMNT_0026920919 /DNA_START=196 /DNA_END=579 /DNA_ORIENTATION=-
MQAPGDLPVLSTPRDEFRLGPGSARTELAPQHPVERMQKMKRETEMEARMRDLTAQQGVAAAMRYKADHKILSSFHRLPGIQSSFAALDNYTGNDLTLRVEDWLGEPEDSPQFLCDFHATMERKLGM